ncbi:DUF3040 family protein [Actinomycetospora succinea]|uniref:DUF3040 family protein n=1 Tax=Actinomycetospora succinea TaxID=663603 RepID=A0A4R6V1X1_9PSEU|nr:DUF3040 domain-containing protein [Actinomycetospora succinea]TDQ53912.1 DUF3040 family protein [Actinomycetospora succinea]
MLDDRERGQLEEIERALLEDPGLQRRLRAPGARLRSRLATPSLVAFCVFLAVVAVAVLSLGLPLQAMAVVAVGLWPWSALRRRLRARRRGPLTP